MTLDASELAMDEVGTVDELPVSPGVPEGARSRAASGKRKISEVRLVRDLNLLRPGKYNLLGRTGDCP